MTQVFRCVAFLVTAWLVAPTAQAKAPSFDERVAAERAIEEVYWRHRIWPLENPDPKPPLSALLPDEAIRAQVEDTLRKSDALARIWRRPVTGPDLQAELDRMSRRTRDPQVLRELYAALGNDARLIAETLARETLVEREIRDLYAYDDRFHGVLEQRARAALGSTTHVGEMSSLGGAYSVATYELRSGGEESAEHGEAARVIGLEPDEWSAWSRRVAGWFGAAAVEAVPVGRPSGLVEEADRFFTAAVLSRGEGRATIATTTWAKRSFDAWWAEERSGFDPEAQVDLGDLVLPLPAGSACAMDTWDLRFYAAGPRLFHTAVWTGTEMIVWGGYGNASIVSFLNTGGRYTPSTDTWTATSVGANVPAARQVHTAVWTGTEMIVWGGLGNSSGLTTGGRYSPSSDTWTATSTAATVPLPRAYHTAVWTGSEMIVWGGLGGISPLATGGRYTPSTNTWTETSVGANVPAPRTGHTAVWTGSEMIVWGGADTTPSATGGRYTPSTNAWTETSVGANVPAPRTGHTAVWTGTEMVVWGGLGGSYLGTGGRYTPLTNTWTATSAGESAPAPRAYHTAVWTGTEMIAWGGLGGSYLGTGGRYTPGTDTWAATPAGENAPGPRAFHAAVWTGSEMIVWGGSNPIGASPLNTGSRYSPSANQWTATSTGASVPESRSGHTVVWTGAEMIAWGGDGELDSGGRYVPSTDAWTPTSVEADVPAPRSGHTAVWTGEEMIVWGGLASGLSLDSGGRYFPATNIWTPTSVGAGVPAPRSGHTAVWTGEEMIVWGGLDGDALNTGGRYVPSADTWVTTSVGAGVPAPRSDHTAIWTGEQMLVWGGAAGSAQLATGGRYAPSTNTWTATGTGPNVPAPREAHTSVWTGTEMIVWGGRGGGSSLNTGGRYAPSTNTWTATTTGANVPAPREAHTAVWTGAEMVVWGGLGDGSYLGTGGRYAPSTNTWAATSVGASTPTPRIGHSAVWTGSEMIVWAGDPLTADIGLYCTTGCVLPAPVWRDHDADGYGFRLEQAASLTCAPPAGYASNQDDCDDERDAVRPGASEICDSVCNDCDGGWPALVDFDGDQIEDACETGAILSDANNSGRVDGFDLTQLALSFGTCDGAPAYARAVDLDRDDCVDGADLAILAAVFGQSSD